ncbi:MAG: N-acetylmuramoyl-L-alanine amidase [Clostridiales bacterium]|nr:N-acetylmuramoyl-L-alanine amidase [Clostridiales bacterium]
MRGRTGITVVCIYILCFFLFIMFKLGDNRDEPEAVVKPVNNDFVIIIDAGHGGSDGGAVASDGTNEAVINLEIAKKLCDGLSLIGFNTVMTRTDENSLGENSSTIRNEKISDIHKRMDIMNSFDNCVFISVHQNYYRGSSSWGTQVFYSGNNEQSEPLAESIQSSVKALVQPDNKRMIKKSGSDIYLLYKAEKPAVLVECGFMSNDEELLRLKNEDYQCELTFSIIDGIINYISEKDVKYGF